jgi:hypothetical protein
MYRDSSVHSQRIATATSSGSIRWIGIGSSSVPPTPGAVACQCSAAGFWVISVPVPPGWTTLTRMLFPASSSARLFISPMTPFFAAA